MIKETNEQFYKNLITNYSNIIKGYEELTFKLEEKNQKLFIENLNLKDLNEFYKRNILRRAKNKLKDFIGNAVDSIDINIEKILIVDNDVRVFLDEAGGFAFYISYKGSCVYEDNNSYITDKANEIENLSDKAKFYYDNRVELISILREFMIYSDKF
ncbi:hypothetical protein [Brachyspira sp. G79]|uniref:hypothetical protein n=1 Tax=Brachyspira sp. G79 TaxID=1358104 RepID=UPI000BBCBB2B|nr:hypothetical protein [Brachyspira sp. G79]PCG20543.1 hypothetical protein KQ44_11460 [Brachyspira sp. G79]